MKKIVAVFVCLLFLASTLGMTAVVLAAPPDKCEPWPECKGGGEDPPMGTEYQITDWPQWEVVPTIHGNMIVWETFIGGDIELFVYDLGNDGIPFTADDGGQTQITDNYPEVDDFPRIYGNKIVFRRAIGSGDYDLWLYDLDTQTEYQLTDGLDLRTYDIYENIIVYWIWKPGPIRELWIYDLGGDGVPSEDDLEYKITECDGGHWPRIYGNKVVFEWNDDLNIYYVSGDRAGQTVAMGLEYRPIDMEIHENRIVWSDDRNGNYDVFTYDLGPDGEFGTDDDGGEQQLSSSSYSDILSVVYGNRIVWRNFVSRGKQYNYQEDIYLYDLTTQETHKITSSSDARYPCIYNDHIVYQDERDGNWNIYLYILN